MRYEVIFMGYEAGAGGGGVSPAKPSQLMWGFCEQRQDFHAASDVLAVAAAGIIVKQAVRPEGYTDSPRLLKVIRKKSKKSRRRVLINCN